MHFKVEVEQLSKHIDQRKADCTIPDCSEESTYRVTVENEGETLHRTTCAHHPTEVANALFDDLGVVWQLKNDP